MHMPLRNAFVVSVPASSANLGPGFDAVGIALDLRVRATVQPANRFALRFSGPHAPSHDGYADAILAAMKRVNERLPRVKMHVENGIPLGKGLGSSAAASVLGLVVASRARGEILSRERLAHLACELEGHPDNALAAIYGGTVVAASADARDCVRIDAPRDLCALVVVPEFELATREARALLPDRYDRGDMIYTAQRASLLGAALGSGSWKALRAAMHDRLHQPYRAAHVPGLAAALALRARRLIGIALSGAGPSVLAILHEDAPWRTIAQRLEACFASAGVAARAHRLAFAARGVMVRGNYGV
jgi:homoserine kinase